MNSDTEADMEPEIVVVDECDEVTPEDWAAVEHWLEPRVFRCSEEDAEVVYVEYGGES